MNKLWALLCLVLLISCTQEKKLETDTVFTTWESSKSHIEFANTVLENDTLNYFTFPYLYLGGGVSTGDINNDGLTDIYFTGNQVPNKLYLNRGNLEFEDISEKAGVSGDERWYSGATMTDINHDGFLDIYVSVSGKFGKSANQLFINQGDNTFTEEAKTYGIADESTSIQSTFFDYNNDGYLDLFVANYPLVPVSMGNKFYKTQMDRNRWVDSGHLYKNTGAGTFVDVTDEAGVHRFGLTLGIVASDFNGDGFTDLYLSNDFNVPDYFYQNQGDGTFIEISKKSLNHTSMFGMGVDAADFNNDGLLDLFQLDMTAEDYKRSKTNMASMSPETFYEAVDLGFNYQYMQNSLQLNNGQNVEGNPVFSEVSRMAGVSTTDWSWGVVFADLNNDALKDVFISNGIKRDVNNNDVNKAFEEATFFGREAIPDFSLMPSTPISNYAFENKGDFNFSKVSKKWGLDQESLSNGFAVADLDNDGDLDLVINNLDDRASLYVNETASSQQGYLKVTLQGPKHNPFGLGTKVSLTSTDWKQTQELTLTRGYQSSMEPVLHFGLGDKKSITEIKVVWPDGKQQSISNISANQLIEIKYTDALSNPVQEKNSGREGFVDISSKSKLAFNHKEDLYDDFKLEPLLPHKNSQFGPALAVADINKDGLDDFFVGNAAGSSAAMYIQKENGSFELVKGPWEEDREFEDTGALIFDADNDSDLDVYVVNGGNDALKAQSYYQDRLYLQTAEGFVKSKEALPPVTASGRVVEAGDFDADGDLDLFIGGRIVPGKYPYPAQSYVLRNEGGKDQALRYTDVTEELAPQLKEAGLVCAVLWDDFDQDGKIDLVLTGEWMPLRFFRNIGPGFEEVTEEMGLSENTGWWKSLEKVDVDGDGDMDYIGGNLGLNYKYQASTEKPFEIYANDFDENGTTDIVLSLEKSGTKVPLRGRECSSQQVPAISQRFKTFELFADASLADIYGKTMLDKSLHYKANNFAHHWFENKGGGRFEKHLLPKQAQFSSLNAIHVFDYNQDEFPDLLLGGNLYHAEVETPRADASIGLVLVGTQSGEFEVIPAAQSGLMLRGEIMDIQGIRMANGKKGFLIGRNDLPLQVLSLRN